MSKEAWVAFDSTGTPKALIVEANDDGTTTLDSGEFAALASQLGLSQTSHIPGEAEPFDVEADAQRPARPLGNQRLGEPNRRESADDSDDSEHDDHGPEATDEPEKDDEGHTLPVMGDDDES